MSRFPTASSTNTLNELRSSTDEEEQNKSAWRVNPPSAEEIDANPWWQIEYSGSVGSRRSRTVEFGVTESGRVVFDLGSLGIFEAKSDGDIRYAPGVAPTPEEP